MIENVNQLIEHANNIESESERVAFVMNYFFNTVEYDYTYLLIKGYLQETISEINPSSPDDLVENPFAKGKVSIPINGNYEEFSDTFCITTTIAKGESRLLDRMVKATEECDGDFEKYKEIIGKILEEELRKHLNNEAIIKSSIERFLEKLSNDKNRNVGKIVNTGSEKYFVARDIKSIIITYLLEPNKHFPHIIEDGLIRRGVCQHYANYLVDLLDKIEIVSIRVDGTSELGHAWVAAIIDNECKSIDLTRAVFIRDGFIGIPSDQKSEDWLIADFEDTFKMQNSRTITGVGIDDDGESIPTPYVMDGTNFNSDELLQLIRTRKNVMGEEPQGDKIKL